MSAKHSILQQVLCLLLCVGAWRGPVPMLHDHDDLTNADLRERHCCVYHGNERSDAGSAALPDGMHWHFAFPSDVNGEPVSQSDQIPPESAAFACAAVSLSIEVTWETALDELSSSSFCRWTSEELFSIRPLHADASHDVFLSSMLQNAPLVAVTGVCLI